MIHRDDLLDHLGSLLIIGQSVNIVNYNVLFFVLLLVFFVNIHLSM